MGSQNPSDLRQYGQLKFLFSPKKKVDPKPEEEKEEEQETYEDLSEQKFPDNLEVLDEDYSSDYFDKFLEDRDNLKIQEQDVEEATVTEDEESMDTDNIETKDNKLEEDDEGCNGPEYDDFYGEFCPREHRFRRDATEDFLGGIWRTGEKLLDGNIGGSITTFLKTLAQPVFHYLIHSNNDPVIEKFTTRFIPETSLQGSSNALMIQGALDDPWRL